ncbi:MAG: hypothetical protein Q9202_005768 [Teloschistes flavicans]
MAFEVPRQQTSSSPRAITKASVLCNLDHDATIDITTFRAVGSEPEGTSSIVPRLPKLQYQNHRVMATAVTNAESARNISGATIFIGYVFAALLLTMMIIGDLFKAYRTRIQAKPRSKDMTEIFKQLQIFIALAVLSFSTLSYHMLSYLICSYRTWATHTSSGTTPNLCGLFSVKSLQSIWQWLTESTLFKGFAETICQNKANYWWTQQALLVTMAAALFISIEGKPVERKGLKLSSKVDRSRNIAGSRRQVPHLWAYLAIGQILPISFAQNLFFIATRLFPIPDPKRIMRIPGLNSQCLPLAMYCSAVHLVPRSVGTTSFVPIVVLIRALLLCPLLVRMMNTGSRTNASQNVHAGYSATYRMALACAGFLSAQETFRAFVDDGFSQVLVAINSNPAVSALGYDFILYVISCWTYRKHGAFRCIDVAVSHAWEATNSLGIQRGNLNSAEGGLNNEGAAEL